METCTIEPRTESFKTFPTYTPHKKSPNMRNMQRNFLGICKLLKSCVCDALGLVSRKEFETQKEIIEKLNREIDKIKSVKRKV